MERLASLMVPVLTITTLLLLLRPMVRYSFLSLAVQTLAVMIITASLWTPWLAAIKGLAGWVACILLWTAARSSADDLASVPSVEGRMALSSFIFRFLLAALVWILVFPLSPTLSGLLSIPVAPAQGALLLIGMGMIQLGLSARPLPVMLGLLTTLSGFEILYAAVDQSLMVVALLAVVNVGLGFVGATQLLSVQSPDDLQAGEDS